MKPQYDHAISFMWVKNWDRAVHFYGDILGLTKAYESEGWAEFSVPGTRDSYIALNRWAKDEPHPTNHFITLRLKNLDEFRTYLKEKNVFLRGDVQEFLDENQGLRMFKFEDPEGNVLTAASIEN